MSTVGTCAGMALSSGRGTETQWGNGDSVPGAVISERPSMMYYTLVLADRQAMKGMMVHHGPRVYV